LEETRVSRRRRAIQCGHAPVRLEQSFERTLVSARDGKAIHTKGLTIARLNMQKSAAAPEHSHVHEQIAMVENCALKFFFDGGERIVKAGESLAIPSNAPHRVEAMEDTAAVDVFSPCREETGSGGTIRT
jgi:quercetin dioxygenase-like cupin family protein